MFSGRFSFSSKGKAAGVRGYLAGFTGLSSYMGWMTVVAPPDKHYANFDAARAISRES